MTKKKEQEIKPIDKDNLNYFPIGSHNKVRNRFTYGTDLYIEVKDEFNYKVF